MKRIIERYKELTEVQNKMMQEMWWAYTDATNKINGNMHIDTVSEFNSSTLDICAKLKEHQKRIDELKQLIDLEEDNIIYKESKERAAK